MQQPAVPFIRVPLLHFNCLLGLRSESLYGKFFWLVLWLGQAAAAQKRVEVLVSFSMYFPEWGRAPTYVRAN